MVNLLFVCLWCAHSIAGPVEYEELCKCIIFMDQWAGFVMGCEKMPSKRICLLSLMLSFVLSGVFLFYTRRNTYLFMLYSFQNR